MGFKVGDKVALKPDQSAEDEVLTHLRYGEVYEVAEVIGGNEGTITLVHNRYQEWLEQRFQLAAVPRPERGDVIEVTVRAKVSALLTISDPAYGKPRTVVYLEGDQSITLYNNGGDGVQSLRIVEPAKPKLDLDALPERTVVQASTGEVYVKRDAANHRYYDPWSDMNGSTLSSALLALQHSELVELAPKGSAASA